MSATLKVLYDGWPLIHMSESSAALHLLELLQQKPDGIEALLALPATAEEVRGIPPSIVVLGEPAGSTPADRLTWEQRTLTRLRKSSRATWLHRTLPGAPLMDGGATLISAALNPFASRRDWGGWLGRLGWALGEGGLSGAEVIYPADWPDIPAQALRLPPLVLPEFNPTDAPESTWRDSLRLPEAYLLYHGSRAPEDITAALAAWTWASAPLGDAYSLLLAGLDQPAITWAQAEAQRLNLPGGIHILGQTPLAALPSLYRGAAAVLCVGEISPWANPLRYALACQRPVIGFETPLTGGMAGTAGYLVTNGDTRALGAAILTVLVNEDVAGKMQQAAGKIAAAWEMEQFGAALYRLYRAID